MNPKTFVRRAVKGYRKILAKRKEEIEALPPTTPTIQTIPIPTPPSVVKVGEKVKPIKVFPPSPVVKIVEKPSPAVVKIVERVKPIEKEEMEIEEKIEGVELPELVLPTKIRLVKREKEAPLKLAYSLIPKAPKKDEIVFAYAKIFWDEKMKNYVYSVVEPVLSDKLKGILSRVKELLEQRLDIDLSKLKMVEASEYLKKQINDIIDYFGFKITPTEREILRYYVERDFLGLGKIEPLMRDDDIEDISCDGVNIPIFVYHRDPRIGSAITNILFKEKEELDSFVTRLAQISGKSISVAEPLVDATLPDGSRLQATLGTDIARKGSNFTIRKFLREPLTPTHLLNYKTIDARCMAYLWLAVDYGKSILVSGGTASGKTTLLNVLSLFIRPEKRVVSIEDTAELQLPHPHWVPTVARTPISRPEKEEVDLFKLLKESIRQRPEYIIVGEVRGQEAFILFQQIASIPAYENIIILNENNFKQLPISKLKMNKKIRTFAINPSTEKVGIFDVEAKVTHEFDGDIYKITTKTGREIEVTPYHSLLIHKNGLSPVLVNQLKVGDKIAIPARIPSGYNNVTHFNLIELLPNIRVYSPQLIKEASRKLGFKRASKLCKITTISNYYGVNNCALPATKFKKLMKKANIQYSLDEVKVRFKGNSPLSSARLEITPHFLRLLGYFISGGSLDRAKRNNSITLYYKNPEILADMKECIFKVTGKVPRERKFKGWGEAWELRFNHRTIFELLIRLCGATSKEKRIPGFIFGLSKSRIGEFLSALYASNGSLQEKQYSYYTTSRRLANDLLLLLLSLNIIGIVKERKVNKRIGYEIRFYRKDYQQKFLKFVRSIASIPKPRLENVRDDEKDIYLDEIKSIKKIKTNSKIVYDLSIPRAQNFIGGFGGILLHNTGHPSLATIHADTIQKLFDRLTTPPISLPPGLIGSLDLIVFLCRVRYKEKFIRKVTEILEMVRYDEKRGKPIANKVFEWNPFTDKFEVAGKSILLKKISSATGIKEEELVEELKRRILILEWMRKRNITSYQDVYKILTEYYHNPNRLLATVVREVG